MKMLLLSFCFINKQDCISFALFFSPLLNYGQVYIIHYNTNVLLRTLYQCIVRAYTVVWEFFHPIIIIQFDFPYFFFL